MKIIIAIVLSTITSIASAYEGSPKEQVASFFSELSTGKASKAIDNLYSSNPLFSQKLQSLVVLKQQLESVPSLYGKYIGSEPVTYEEISPSITRIVQIAKYEGHPLVWEFYFYKTNNKWTISQGMFGDQFQYIGSKK